MRQARIRSGSRTCILAHEELTTELRDSAHFSPKDYWGARARGTGGSQTDPYCSFGEANLFGYPGDSCAAACILTCEFARNTDLRSLVNPDPTFDRRLKEACETAMSQEVWNGALESYGARRVHIARILNGPIWLRPWPH